MQPATPAARSDLKPVIAALFGIPAAVIDLAAWLSYLPGPTPARTAESVR
jgi:hypothetical protein